MSTEIINPDENRPVPAPRHMGRLPDGPQGFSGRAGSVERGTVVEMAIRLEGGAVAEAGFMAFGDEYVFACAEHCCAIVVGQSPRQLEQLTGVELAETAGLPRSVLGVALIVEDALKAALAQTTG